MPFKNDCARNGNHPSRGSIETHLIKVIKGFLMRNRATLVAAVELGAVSLAVFADGNVFLNTNARAGGFRSRRVYVHYVTWARLAASQIVRRKPHRRIPRRGRLLQLQQGIQPCENSLPR